MKKLQGTRRWLGFTFATIVTLLISVSPARAQALGPDSVLEAAGQPAPGFPVLPGIWRLHGIDPNLPTDDLEPLRRIVGKASVVGLGESFHSSGGFYTMKHRMFRYLVENMGFRVFAIESGWTGADLAARYVETCEGSPEEALRRHIIVWRSTELGDLAQWMCEWNRDHSNPADKVHYFGFDIQQPEDDGPALLAFLQRIGIAEDHPWVAGIQACEGVTAMHPNGEIPQATHDRCIQALKGIETHIQRNRSALLRQMSPEDLEIARLQVIGLRAWQLQIFLIFDDFAAGYSARDEGMAYAFLKLRALRFPKARTVVWAANSHVSRTGLPNGARPLGSHLAAALGRDYVSFGFTAHEAESPLLAVNCGTYVPDSRSVEERLHALGEETLLVDLAFPGTRSPYLRRGLYPVGSETLEPHRNFTGMIYLERSDGMHSYEWAPCR